MDRGAWRATVHGVVQSWTWLKPLSTCGFSGVVIVKLSPFLFIFSQNSSWSSWILSKRNEFWGEEKLDFGWDIRQSSRVNRKYLSIYFPKSRVQDRDCGAHVSLRVCSSGKFVRKERISTGRSKELSEDVVSDVSSLELCILRQRGWNFIPPLTRTISAITCLLPWGRGDWNLPDISEWGVPVSRRWCSGERCRYPYKLLDAVHTAAG